MKKYIILTLTLSMSAFLFAQVDYQISNFKVSIAGTSTVHDWTADVNSVSGIADLEMTNGELTGLINLNVKIDANSIKSEKGSMMDKNIYKALKTKDNNYITFKLKKVKSLTTTGNMTNLSVDGDLTIAGATKLVNLRATGTENDGSYKFEGSKKIKMTDYNVEPPTFMFGAMTTGDEVTITYEVTFTNNGLTHK